MPDDDRRETSGGRLVVLGMHRSGTSACTAALHSMGAYVGREEELTGRSDENPLGFFERRDIRNVCDALLAGASADWWKVAAFDPSSIPDDVLSRQSVRLRSILTELDGAGIWAIKEPRLCLLVPALREVLGEAMFVHIVRDPVEVAKSLRHRNGFPMQAGLALWEVYNVAVLRNTAGHRRIVVGYDALVADPAATLRQLKSSLADMGIALGEGDAGVVVPELHREHASDDERHLLSDAQSRLWQQLKEGGERSASVSDVALRVLREFEEDRSELLQLRKRLGAFEADARQPKKVDGEVTGSGVAAKMNRTIRFASQRDAHWRRLIEKREAAIALLGRRLAKANSDFDRLVRDTKKAADVGSLSRLRARLLGAVHRSKSNAPPPSVNDVIETSVAKRLAARAKEQRKTPLPDTEHDVGQLPSAIGRSRAGLGRVAFVTAIADRYDPLLDPSVVDLSADYVLFTDDPDIKSDVWETRPFDFVHADPARTARFVKTHPHLYFRGYDRVIWVDGNLGINCLVEDLISAEDADIIIWRHPLRDCVYAEAEECIFRQKDDEVTIREHVAMLKRMSYPERNGLVESSVMAVNLKGEGVADFFSDWWRLIDNGSRRDQMSFNPALSLHPGLRLGFLGNPGVEMRTDQRFTYHRHPSYRRPKRRKKEAKAS